MLYSTIILTLAAAASAIDIRFFSEAHCRNSIGYSCTNVGPNSCCNGQRSNGWAALSVSSIPTNWDVLTRAYTAEGCADKDLLNQFRSESRSELCHGDNRGYKSGNYRFAGKKIRGISDARDVVSEDCVEPDTLYFADDSSYNISGLTGAQVDELVCSTLLSYRPSLLTLLIVSAMCYEQIAC